MRPRSSQRLLIAFCIVVIVAGAYGFTYKLVQFAKTLAERGNFEHFAVFPMATYFLTVLGFLCLFVWAYLRGQFKDIEAPKYRMLEMEDEYDAEEERTR